MVDVEGMMVEHDFFLRCRYYGWLRSSCGDDPPFIVNNRFSVLFKDRPCQGLAFLEGCTGASLLTRAFSDSFGSGTSPPMHRGLGK